MTRFRRLLMSPGWISPAIVQDRAALKFLDTVKESLLNIWSVGGGVPSKGTRILTGIASYSVADLDWLDTLETELFRIHRIIPLRNLPKIDVFDIARLETETDLEKLMPGAKWNAVTPLVEIWHDGKRIQRSQGVRARQLVLALLHQLRCEELA